MKISVVIAKAEIHEGKINQFPGVLLQKRKPKNVTRIKKVVDAHSLAVQFSSADLTDPDQMAERDPFHEVPTNRENDHL